MTEILIVPNIDKNVEETELCPTTSGNVYNDTTIWQVLKDLYTYTMI